MEHKLGGFGRLRTSENHYHLQFYWCQILLRGHGNVGNPHTYAMRMMHIGIILLVNDEYVVWITILCTCDHEKLLICIPKFAVDNHLFRIIWVCLKIGYIPNYSHLIGIMISKTIGFRGTLFSDTPICSLGRSITIFHCFHQVSQIFSTFVATGHVPWMPCFFRCRKKHGAPAHGRKTKCHVISYIIIHMCM